MLLHYKLFLKIQYVLLIFSLLWNNMFRGLFYLLFSLFFFKLKIYINNSKYFFFLFTLKDESRTNLITINAKPFHGRFMESIQILFSYKNSFFKNKNQ